MSFMNLRYLQFDTCAHHARRVLSAALGRAALSSKSMSQWDPGTIVKRIRLHSSCSMSEPIDQQPVRVQESALRVGIIGCGRIGRLHCKTVTQTNGLANLAWISDSQSSAIQKYVKELKTQFVDCSKLEETLKASPENSHFVDAVIVCTPTSTHPHYVSMCLNHHKPILCEKPMTPDPFEMRKLFALAEQKKTRLDIGFQRVFDSDIENLIERIRSHHEQNGTSPWSVSMKTFDSPTAPSEYLRLCGSVFSDAMCHDFHVASSLLPSDDKITSAVATEAPFDDASMGARSATVTFLTNKGTLIASEFHRVSQIGYDNTIDVAFPNKMFRLESRPRYAITEAEGTGSLNSADYATSFMTKYSNAYVHEVVTFLESVRLGQKDVNQRHIRECIRAMWMVKMAEEASLSGRKITSQ